MPQTRSLNKLHSPSSYRAHVLYQLQRCNGRFQVAAITSINSKAFNYEHFMCLQFQILRLHSLKGDKLWGFKSSVLWQYIFAVIKENMFFSFFVFFFLIFLQQRFKFLEYFMNRERRVISSFVNNFKRSI